MVILCEVLVDVIKHSFLAKFNEIKPGAYSEFLQALCKQVIGHSLVFVFCEQCGVCNMGLCLSVCILHCHLFLG